MIIMGGQRVSVETKSLAHDNNYATYPRTMGMLVEKSRKKRFGAGIDDKSRRELGERRKRATTTVMHARTYAQRNWLTGAMAWMIGRASAGTIIGGRPWW
jgi:hypothetical protein